MPKTNKKDFLKVGSYVVDLTNTDKLLFPKNKITKGDLIDYYCAIASVMLPYVKKRPISMHRYPNDIAHEGFYQKNASDYFPTWITRKPLKTEQGETVNYVVIDKAATLVYLANQGCITPHIWLSKIDKLNYPDRLIFDLDPSGKTFDFSKVRKTALVLKELLAALSLVPFVMTTGSRGLHVVVPLKRLDNFDTVRSFARSVAQYLVKHDAKNLTIEIHKKKRGRKIFIDYLRNAYSATGVAPYAVRARDHAPVAAPIDWDEVHEARLRSDRYTIVTIFDRLKKHGDPWKDIAKSAKSLKTAIKKFQHYRSL